MSHRFWILVTLAVCCITLRTHALKTERIVGGNEAHVTNVPHQVSIRRKLCSSCAFDHFTSGAIYSANLVLTSASGVRLEDTKDLAVIAGTTHRTASEGMIFPVEKKLIHENFDLYTLNNDIALLKLKVDIPLGSSYPVGALKIAYALPAVGTVGLVAGWGKTSENGDYSEIIKSVRIPIVSRESCQNAHKFSEITENMFCAGVAEGGSDACKGDAGAPFVVANEMVGLVSWGVGCGRPNSPGVYTNLVQLREWIEESANSL